MEVLLLKDVPKLGQAGEVLKVSDGYARNFLFPQRLAVIADEGARRQAQDVKTARKNREEKQAAESSALAQKIEGATVTLEARAGEKGKLYGSITAGDIADALKKATTIEIDRRRLELEEPIRELGEYTVVLKLAPKVSAKINVVIKAAEQE